MDWVWGLGCREGGIIKGHKETCGEDGYVLILVVMVFHGCTHSQSSSSCSLQYVQFIVCQLYLSKAVKKKKSHDPHPAETHSWEVRGGGHRHKSSSKKPLEEEKGKEGACPVEGTAESVAAGRPRAE